MFKFLILASLSTLMVTAFSVNRYRQQSEDEYFLRLLKSECDKYGSSDSFDKLMGEQARYKLNFRKIVTDIKAETEDKDAQAIVRSLCRKVPELREGYTKLFKLTEPCTEPEKRDNVHKFIDAVDDVTDFLCAKDAEAVISFLDEDGPACAESVTKEMVSCAQPAFTKYDQTNANFTVEERCRDMSSLKHCVLDNMKSCPKPGPARFMNSIFTIMSNHVPCNATSTNEIE